MLSPSMLAGSAIPILLLTVNVYAFSEDTPQNAGLGAKVFAENCARCHEAPDPASRSGREWRGITMHMRIFADISREEQQNVLIFLRTFNTAAMSRTPGLPSPH
jgi:hypothetical protein